MFEAHTVLGALAAVTSSATLLTLASPVTLRAPGLLAKAVTTLDVISGGRAVLSVGAGWDAAEHEAYGIEFPPPTSGSVGSRRNEPTLRQQSRQLIVLPSRQAWCTSAHRARVRQRHINLLAPL